MSSSFLRGVRLVDLEVQRMHFSSFEMLLQYLKLVGFQNSHFSSFGVLLQYFKLVGVQN